MTLARRQLLGGLAASAAAATLGSLSGSGRAADDEYRALVVVFLNGGNDGHNVLVPTDAAYNDYQLGRQNLALPRASLLPLPGSAIGHTFGLHPALQPMVDLYGRGRLAFIANVGPLAQPATAAEVLADAVEVPPFLLSHSDQTAVAQGWTVNDDMSGWAGRGLELLPSRLRNRFAAVTSDTHRTLVLGHRSPVSFLDSNSSSWWGLGDLAQPQQIGVQSLARMARWQFANAYEAEYARTYGLAFDDATFIAEARKAAIVPSADFGPDSESVSRGLRNLASLLPYFKSQGLKRQVFLQTWGRLDTHTNQRGTADTNTQDSQLAILAQALAAFDATNRASGLDANVVTLVMTEFGRTIRPGSGGGSEHAWGNHWFAFGGPVAGGTVVGTFPNLVLGGPDDGDRGKNGRMVPTTSTDQVGASLMQWLGLAPSQFHDAFPWLVNFRNKTVPLLRA